WCSHHRDAAPGSQWPSSSGDQMKTGITGLPRWTAASSAGLSVRRRSRRNQSRLVSFMSTTGSKDFGDLESAIIEDRLQVGFHHPGMCELAQEPKGKDVSNHVTHQSSPIHCLKAMGMVPEPVRALGLHVHKLVRRIPGLNLGQPPQGQSVPTEPVLDSGSRPHVDWLGRENPKAQERRRDLFEVPGVRKEGKHVLDRLGNPLFAPQEVRAHVWYHHFFLSIRWHTPSTCRFRMSGRSSTGYSCRNDSAVESSRSSPMPLVSAPD